MNAEAILTKIEEDAREAAAKLQSDAETKVAEMKAASREKVETMQCAMLSQAEKDSAEQQERLWRMASLDERKSFLAQKRQLIEETFTLARQKLAGAPADKRRDFFRGQILSCSNGMERLVVGAEHDDWFDDLFVNEVNQALSEAGKRGELTAEMQRRPDCTGVILCTDGTEIDCTFEALLGDARGELEQQVAAILFGEN